MFCRPTQILMPPADEEGSRTIDSGDTLFMQGTCLLPSEVVCMNRTWANWQTPSAWPVLATVDGSMQMRSFDDVYTSGCICVVRRDTVDASNQLGQMRRKVEEVMKEVFSAMRYKEDQAGIPDEMDQLKPCLVISKNCSIERVHSARSGNLRTKKGMRILCAIVFDRRPMLPRPITASTLQKMKRMEIAHTLYYAMCQEQEDAFWSSRSHAELMAGMYG